jgi:hypothetical protein
MEFLKNAFNFLFKKNLIEISGHPKDSNYEIEIDNSIAINFPLIK